MRTTIRLDDELIAAAKQRAARSNRTPTAVIEDALRQTLAPPKAEQRRQPVELATFHGDPAGLAPGVDLDDSAALLELMEEGLSVDKRR